MSIESLMWDVNTGEAKGCSHESSSLNNDLNSIQMILYTYYRNLSEKCEVITADKLRKMYTQTETFPQTLLTLFRKHNEDELKYIFIYIFTGNKLTVIETHTMIEKNFNIGCNYRFTVFANRVH
ncbi:hypothetical protein JGH11_07845 [Dysgonomonas sp. Marseille-P4677]|nr:hypothetical protein [Dysgonomonas sp. Marseille-P4677]